MPSHSRKHIIKTILIIVGLGIIVLAPVLYNTFFKPSEIIEVEKPEEKYEVIGLSVEGRKIESYTYGEGDRHLLFVGGIHGGYEWNSVVLAYRFMDFFSENPDVIPEGIKVSVIPSLNPDGLYDFIGKEGRFTISDVPIDEEGSEEGLGRFNANDIDLNRNFDCKWEEEGVWRGNVVSAGTEPFSEPEAKALRDFILENTPVAVIFWHSQADAVYASECEDGILSETLTIMNTYSKASRYLAVESFDAYEVTGDAEGWLASIGIPAITVELSTHETVEWERNLAGVRAILLYYEKKINLVR
jgi:hypothetical protein